LAKRPTTDTPPPLPSAEEVEAFLRATPGFLASRPALLADVLPDRPLGDNVIDLQGHALRRLRAEMDDLRGGAEELIVNARANMSIQGRTLDGALALLRAESFDHLVRIVTDDLPLTLEVDLVTLCFEPGLPKGAAIYVQEMPAGSVDAMIGHGPAHRLRPQVEGEDVLYGAGAGLVRSDALIRLPLTDPALPPGILALGSRRADAFHPGMATDLLTFLAAVTAHCVERWVRH
jgi:uncharacterized protein YigA (DUF484 family)